MENFLGCQTIRFVSFWNQRYIHVICIFLLWTQTSLKSISSLQSISIQLLWVLNNLVVCQTNFQKDFLFKISTNRRLTIRVAEGINLPHKYWKTVSKRSLCFLSATQFCCGVLTMDFWCKMPFEAKKNHARNHWWTQCHWHFWLTVFWF